VKVFSVERILASIGNDRVDTSLMMFSLPAIVPVPQPKGFVTVPTSAIACQMVRGRKRVRLPRAILTKCVSRKSLAVAIHAILPILEAAEKVVRPRWSWVNHATSRRVIGMFVFLLAIAIGFPLFGFDALHAMSIFVISLGLAESDGLAVVLGLVAGLLSLAIIAAGGLSVRALRFKLRAWLRRMGRKLGATAFASLLDRLGFKRLARMLGFEWPELLLLWDPEQRPAGVSNVQHAEPAQSASEASAPLLAAVGA
jgi:hypothetical protein